MTSLRAVFSTAALVQNLQTGFNNKENKNKFSNLIATRRALKIIQQEHFRLI